MCFLSFNPPTHIHTSKHISKSTIRWEKRQKQNLHHQHHDLSKLGSFGTIKYYQIAIKNSDDELKLDKVCLGSVSPYQIHVHRIPYGMLVTPSHNQVRFNTAPRKLAFTSFWDCMCWWLPSSSDYRSSPDTNE